MLTSTLVWHCQGQFLLTNHIFSTETAQSPIRAAFRFPINVPSKVCFLQLTLLRTRDTLVGKSRRAARAAIAPRRVSQSQHDQHTGANCGVAASRDTCWRPLRLGGPDILTVRWARRAPYKLSAELTSLLTHLALLAVRGGVQWGGVECGVVSQPVVAVVYRPRGCVPCVFTCQRGAG